MNATHYDGTFDIEAMLAKVHHLYPDGCSNYQLAAIDQLHTGGIKASEQLVSLLKDSGQKPKILDIGCGLGGLLRLISTEMDCELIGVDITHNFNVADHQLNKLCSLDSRLTTADAQSLPFTNQCFDFVIFQHSLVNIPNLNQALAEAKRVLKPDGKVLFHELISGSNIQKVLFPVPWALCKEESKLLTKEEISSSLHAQGLHINRETNLTDKTLAWFTKQHNKRVETNETGLNPSLVLGNQFKLMAKNVYSNLASGAIEVIQYEITINSNK